MGWATGLVAVGRVDFALLTLLTIQPLLGHALLSHFFLIAPRMLDLDQLVSSAAGCFTVGTCKPIFWREITVPGPRPQSSFG